MSNRRSQLKLSKLRHSSLDLADPDWNRKHQSADVLSKAKNKLFLLSDALKHKKNEDPAIQKSMTQCTLDYFFKHSQPKHDEGPKRPLQKQTSVGSHPQIRVSSFENDLDLEGGFLNRLRPATVCVDRPSVERRSAEALALERPRKKLSFKEPEVDSNSLKTKGKFQNTLKSCEKLLKKSDNNHAKGGFTLGKGIQSIAGLGLTVVTNGGQNSEDDDLESQAMRIVRTVGQAFEVCHKLSISAPEDNFDDEQDTTVTQDLLSDRLSDVTSDKPKKDVETDRNSLQPDESSLKDSYLDSSIKSRKPPPQLDVLPPPPPTQSARKSSPLHAETYAAPHSDPFANSTGTAATLPPPGSALSAHHEIQLLREQLEQQRQQTQAAVAQLQLAREQMQAEQTARMEAQARTHQLLVHNRELLDHIAALVAHLQGGDKMEKPSSPPHVTMPQASPDTLQALGNCHSPLRSTFTPGGMFNFSYPGQLEGSFESQMLQRLGSYPPLNPYGYPPPSPFLSQPYYNQTLMPLQAYATLPRTYPNVERSRHSEPRQIYSMQPKDQHQNEYQPQYGEMQRRHSLLNLNEDPPKKTVQINQERSSKPSEGLIKPLSQVGTLTTTDSEGRVRVIVPVPSNSEDGDKLSDLRISDELRLMNGPGISRSASERVPNRSELLSQVQRTMWARHTTK